MEEALVEGEEEEEEPGAVTPSLRLRASRRSLSGALELHSPITPTHANEAPRSTIITTAFPPPPPAPPPQLLPPSPPRSAIFTLHPTQWPGFSGKPHLLPPPRLTAWVISRTMSSSPHRPRTASRTFPSRRSQNISPSPRGTRRCASTRSTRMVVLSGKRSTITTLQFSLYNGQRSVLSRSLSPLSHYARLLLLIPLSHVRLCLRIHIC